MSQIFDTPTGLPLAKKRDGETVPFDHDISGRISGDVDISAPPTLTATALGRITGASALTIDSVSYSGKVIQFYASGGTTGEVYEVSGLITVGTQVIEMRLAVEIEP